MKKTIILFSAIIGLSACGGSKHDLDADVKEMCDCYSGAKDDAAKFDACSAKFEELKNTYSDDEEAKKKLMHKVANCMIKM